MKKAAQYVNQKSATLTIIIVIIVVGFLLRGWVRITAFPAVVTWTYKGRTNRSLTTADEELHHPFQSLGFTFIKTQPSACGLDGAHGIYIEAGCFAGAQGQTPTVTPNYIAEHATNIAQLQALLTTHHWRESNSQGTPNTLAGFINKSGGLSDYHGYIRFDKSFGGIDCWLEVDRFDNLQGNLTCAKVVSVGYD